MNCPKCKHTFEAPYGKIPFRFTCPSCDKDVHTCKNCQYFHPGKPNDCSIPNSLFVRDREAYNFCDDFRIKGEIEEAKPDTNLLQKVFGDEEVPQKKGKSAFENLFK